MKTRVFRLDDQIAFARLTGDWNPVHVDPLEARRTLFGRPIVHGVHAVLWAVDEVLSAQPRGRVPGRIRVLFKRAIGVDEEIEARITKASPSQTRIALDTGGAPAVTIRIEWTDDPADVGTPVPESSPPREACRSLSLAELSGREGSLDVGLPANARASFPALARCLSPARLAATLATSRLVGMECPGLHSIYSEMDLDLEHAGLSRPVLAWCVEKIDPRFSLASLRATGPGIAANIKAFVRPSARMQASFEALRDHVDSGEFAGQCALIVGGSRGLGEVAAKLLAAGSARVLLTYSTGRDDAERVSGEISTGGGVARAIELDAESSSPPALPEDWKPTQLYYFATPPIFTASGDVFQTPLFERFARFYVTDFVRLVTAVQERSRRLAGVFYPSSVAVEEVPAAMAEYGAAKAAGEVACRYLEQRFPRMRVIRPRLPRLATDQTMSVATVRNADPVPELLAWIRELTSGPSVSSVLPRR